MHCRALPTAYRFQAGQRKSCTQPPYSPPHFPHSPPRPSYSPPRFPLAHTGAGGGESTMEFSAAERLLRGMVGQAVGTGRDAVALAVSGHLGTRPTSAGCVEVSAIRYYQLLLCLPACLTQARTRAYTHTHTHTHTHLHANTHSHSCTLWAHRGLTGGDARTGGGVARQCRLRPLL